MLSCYKFEKLSLMNEAINFGKVGNQQQDWFVVFPAFQIFYFANGRRIEWIGAQSIEGVREESDHTTVSNDSRGAFPRFGCVFGDHYWHD